MSEQDKTKQRLEIAHVLFIDIVDYSKLLTDEQSEALQELNQIVRNTEAARDAEAAGQLTILPTGDGMALVFTGSVEEPAECALEISHALRAQPSLSVRMGIHSGPVHHVKDANERQNIAGVGINIAQRVMDCGDAGHILVSKRVADDLAQQRRWQPYLHELGDVEVKHGAVVSLVNLYAETIGNPTMPKRIGKVHGIVRSKTIGSTVFRSDRPLALATVIVAGLLIALAIVAVIFAPAIMRSLGKGQAITPPQPPAIPSPPSLADTIKSDVAKKIKDELDNAFAAKKKAEDQSRAVGAPRPNESDATIPEKSIAVLPFQNLSDDKSNAYFAEAVQDEILTRLAKVADLKVIARTSTQKFASAPADLSDIAKQLGAANILEGSVQKAGDQVRVNVQLINAMTNAHLWAEIYDRKLTDIFAVESDISKSIADALQAKLTGSEKQAIAMQPTANTDAYELYHKGLSFWRKRSGDNIPKAIAFYQQAIARDPNYALAYAGLSESYVLLPYYTPTRLQESLPKAKEAADKALQLDPNLAEGHRALGKYLTFIMDFAGSTREFKRAIELNPNDATAHHWYGNGPLAALGQFEEAIAEGKRSVELDPLSPVINVDYGNTFYYARRYRDSGAQMRKALDLDQRFAYAHFNFGLVLEATRAFPGAIFQYERALQIDNDPATLALLGAAKTKAGDKSAAEQALAELDKISQQREVLAYSRAILYLSLNNKDQAMRWLEQSFADRDGSNIGYIKVDPLLDSLRGDPRFEMLVQKVINNKP